MAININSEAYCRKAYLNYHCYGNTMGISAEDMGQITQAWGDRVKSWQATVASDENEYDFDDSEYARYKDEGKDAGKEATGGYEKSQGGDIAGAVGRGVAAVGGAIVVKAVKGVANVAAKTIVKKTTEKTVEGVTKKATELVVEKGVENIAKEGAKESGKKALQNSISWSIGAPLALATAIAYFAKKPNKEEKLACDALQPEMTGAQTALTEAQGEMECMSEEIISLSDEANMMNEDTNEEIEEQKTEYDMYYATFMTIKEKVDAGEPLTDSEKELYKEVMGYLSEIGINIEELSEDTTDEVADLYDEIATYQEGYDYTAETMGEIEGLTDYAESFDQTTQTLCYIEGFLQGVNAASGLESGIKASMAGAASLGFNAWAWACAAMGFAGAGMSAWATKEQFQWAGQIGTEIEMRKATQDLNTSTMDIYTEEVDTYDGYMQGVEDLELEIPDDLEAPEETAIPTEGEDSNGTESTEFNDYTDILNEVEEDSKVITENEDGSGKVLLAPEYGTAIAMALGLPDSTTGGKFNQEAIPTIIAQLMPGFAPEDILKVMNGGTLDSSFDASLIQTVTGEDTGKDTSVDNSQTTTEKLRTIINFYKPIFIRASQQGWKC